MRTKPPAVIEQPIAPAVQQADTDQQFIETWIARHESRHTRGNYARQARRFLATVNKPLAEVRVRDLQAFLATLAVQAPATRANATAALKSMFSFGHDLGYLPMNIGKAVKAPSVKNTLAERIMAEADTMRLIALEPDPRNRALLTLTYGAGLRASEVSSLRWRDLAARDGGAGQATAYGKGGKTRMILLSANTWKTLIELRGVAGSFGRLI